MESTRKMNAEITGTTKIRVRYAETDQMGIAYHANYFVWFEIGRIELLRQIGFNYKTMELEDGCFIPVVDVKCRYKAPAHYDDILTIETRTVAIRGSVLRFGYRVVRDSDAQVLAEAETTHIVTDRSMSKCDLPRKYIRALGKE